MNVPTSVTRSNATFWCRLKTAEKLELTLLESMRRESLLALTFRKDITEIEASLHKMHRKIRRRHYKDLIEVFSVILPLQLQNTVKNSNSIFHSYQCKSIYRSFGKA